MAGWEGEEGFGPLPSPPSPLQPRPDSKLASPPHCAWFVSISTPIPSLQGIPRVPTGAWQREAGMCPPKLFLLGSVPTELFSGCGCCWGAGHCQGWGWTAGAHGTRGLPYPGSISPSHLLKGMISVQRSSKTVGRRWRGGRKEAPVWRAVLVLESLAPRAGPNLLFFFNPVCCRTGVGPLGQQAPQLPSLNTVKTIIDFLNTAQERASLVAQMV